MKYVGCVTTDRHGGAGRSLLFSVLLYSHCCSEFLTMSEGAHSAVPVDHASNGRRSRVANTSDQTRGPLMNKRPGSPVTLLMSPPPAAFCAWTTLCVLIRRSSFSGDHESETQTCLVLSALSLPSLTMCCPLEGEMFLWLHSGRGGMVLVSV